MPVSLGSTVKAARLFQPVAGAIASSVVTVGAYGLFNFGISRLPANQASAFVNLIPLFTLFFAVVVLGETLNGQQIAAALVVFAGVALSQWQRPVIPATSVVLD